MLKYNRNYYMKVSTNIGTFVTIAFPLTLDFTISRNTMGGIQGAEFTIFNLGENTRKLITRNTMDYLGQTANQIRTIYVYAGYGPTENLPLVFKGLILSCNSAREEGSTDWQTSISCQDPGLISTQDATFTATPQKSKLGMIQDIINNMNVNSPGLITLAPHVSSIFDSQPNFLGNNQFSGSYQSILHQLTGGNLSGGNFFFENQTLNILLNNEAYDNDGNMVLSDSSELLGAPYYEQTWIFCNMIFEPRIRMGQAIDLQAKDNSWLNGTKKVVAYDHSGTISGSVAGQCHTQIQLFAPLNSQGFDIVGGGTGIV